LIIPKEHSVLISGIDDEALGSMMKLAKKIDQAIRESDSKVEGVNLFLADGAAAGQEVPHAHLHIIPRFKEDGFGLSFPEGYKNKPPKEELEEISEKIKLHLD
jgi:histidine triad (HIT) family protein